jgi:DivIVA domain-containing protein
VVTLLAVLGVLAVLFVAAVVATRDDELLADAPADAADLALPAGPLNAEDVRRVRFGLALRGYRMSEVDEVLERVAAELAERDARLAQPVRLAPPAGSGEDGA